MSHDYIEENLKLLKKDILFLGLKDFQDQKIFLIYVGIALKIYALLPLYELTKNFYKKTIFIKKLNLFEKISLYFIFYQN